MDPATGEALRTWAEAMAVLNDELDADPDRQPEHVIRFGFEAKPVGVLAGTEQAERLIGSLAKYLTKSVGECYAPETVTAQPHQRRLWEELRFTPCSHRCPNWLHYGVQPHKARPKMRAGSCKAKVQARHAGPRRAGPPGVQSNFRDDRKQTFHSSGGSVTAVQQT